jgi:hypothetical protein
MAVNLTNSTEIRVDQSGNDIRLFLTENAIPWKLVANITGGGAINLPATWNEIMIVCTYEDNIYKCITYTLPYGAPTEQYLRLSFYGGVNDFVNAGYWYGSNNDIALHWYVADGTGQDIANIRTQVFYR